MIDWPNQTPTAINKFYGNPDNGSGSADLVWQHANLVTIKPPFAMFYDGKAVRAITVHKKASESLLRVLTAVGKATTADERKRFGIDQFGGTFNFRKKRSGSSLSMHAYGIAIDLAVARNPYLAKYGSLPDMMPQKVIDCFHAEGWTWGGLWSNPDAMHFQAADIPGSGKVAAPSASASHDEITDKPTVAQVQSRLFDLGYTEVGSREKDGSFDGKVGNLTKAAILAFRNDNSLPVVDYIDMTMLVALMTAKPRQLAPARTEAKPSEVREQVPEVKANWFNKIGAYVAGGVSFVGAAFTGVLDNLDGARGYLEPIKQFASDVPPWVWFAILGAGAFALWQNSRKGEAAGVEAFKSGERR